MLAWDVEKGRLQATYREDGECRGGLEPHTHGTLGLSSGAYCSELRRTPRRSFTENVVSYSETEMEQARRETGGTQGKLLLGGCVPVWDIH